MASLCHKCGRVTCDCELQSQLTDLREKVKNLEGNLKAARTQLSEANDTIEQLTESNEGLRAALSKIANHKFINYGAAQGGIYDGQYGIGVVDGHRACAEIAILALGGERAEELKKYLPPSNPIAERAVELLKHKGHFIINVFEHAGYEESDTLNDLRAILSQLQEKPCEHKNCKAGNHPTEGHIVVCLDCGQEQ